MNIMNANNLIQRLLTLVILLSLVIFLAGCPGATADTGHDDHDDHDKQVDHDDHDDHDEDSGDDHDEHAEDSGGDHQEPGDYILIDPEHARGFGIETSIAGPGTIDTDRVLPGEVVFNPDRIAHVLPRVSGVVKQVFHSLGDNVKTGEPLAVLESRELAEAVMDYLAALARLELNQSNYDRIEKLWRDEISSERSYIEARQALEASRIDLTRADRTLHALGMSEQDITQLPEKSVDDFTTYVLLAPIDGVIIERHLVRGEILRNETDEPPYVIADLSGVWINLTVYARDLALIKVAQHVTIRATDLQLTVEGEIDYISPSLDETTRTGTARVVIDNPEGQWRPGLFVTGLVSVDRIEAKIVVPLTSILTIDGEKCLFIEEAPGEYEVRRVVLGTPNHRFIEILEGLEAGERYVSAGGLALKTELDKSALEHAGHAH